MLAYRGTGGGWHSARAFLLLVLGVALAPQAAPAQTAEPPPRPPPLISSAAGDGRVALAWWTPVGDTAITGWQFRQKTGNAAYVSWADISGSDAATRTHTVTGLTNGTPYTFQVRATSGAGHGAPSVAVAATPAVRSLTLTPGQARVTEGSSGGLTEVEVTVTLSENAPSGGVSVWMTSQDGASTALDSGQCPGRLANAPKEMDVCLPSDDAISIAEGSRTGTLVLGVRGDTLAEQDETLVVLVKTSGWGGDVFILTIVDDDVALPAKPADLEAAAGDELVTLFWTDPQDDSITVYELRQHTGSAWGDWADIAGSDASTTSHTVTGLENDSEYRFRIRAKNDGGVGEESDAVRATPSAGLAALALTLSRSEIAVAANATGTWTVALTRARAGAVSIASDDTDTATVSPATLDFSVRNYSSPQEVAVTGKAPGTATISHAFRLAGASADTIPDAGTVTVTVGAPAPVKPRGFTTAAGDGQVTLSWKDPGDSAIVRWQYQQTALRKRGEWMGIDGSDASTTSHTVSGLTNGRYYFFRIRAVNGEGGGAASDEVWSLPSAPGWVVLTAAAGDGQVTLSWTFDRPGVDLTGLWRYRQKSDGRNFEWQQLYVPGKTGSTRVTGLTNGLAYTFAVVNGGDDGAIYYSNEVTVTPIAAPVSLSVADVTAAENGAFAFTVTATPAPSSDVTFRYTVTAETGDAATAGADFTAVTTAAAATIAANASSTTITVSVTDDALDEADETFTVTLSDPSSGVTLADATATGTITDNDESPVLTALTARTVTVGEDVDITAEATDGDGDTVTYAWTRAAGETSPALPGGTFDQARLTFTTTAPGTYTMTVTASDGNGNSDSEQVVITVTAAPNGGPGDDDGGGGGPPGGGGGAPPGGGGGDPPGGGGGDPPGGGGGGPPGGGGGGPPGGGGGDPPGGGGGGPPGGGGGAPPGGGGAPPGGGGGAPPGGGGGAPPGGGGDGEDPGDSDDDDDGDDGSGGAGGPVRASFTLDAPCADGLCRTRTGVRVSFRDTSSGAVTGRTWDFGDGTTSRSLPPVHVWSVPGFYTVSLTVSGQSGSATVSRKLLVEPGDPAGTCAADGETRCLQDARFAVTLDWWTADATGDGARGAGKVVHEGTDDSGLFRFFSEANWEMLVKVLDGCGVNGHVWVYGASATDLGYLLTVTDTVTGAVREYGNEPGDPAPAFTDSAAFPGSCTDAALTATAGAGRSPLTVVAPPAPGFALAPAVIAAQAEDGDCTETATAICLQGGRYQVTVTWSTLAGAEGTARTAIPRTDDSGLFWFFSEANWEMLVKVLDGCSFNDRHWVFAASATDVGFELNVRDTATGQVRQYTKQPGRPATALVDVSAFPEGCQG